MTHRPHISGRIRYTATGALTTLAVVGAIAGSTALAKGDHRTHVRAAPAKSGTNPAVGPAKTPVSPTPNKSHANQPGSDQPFLNAVQRLVSNGAVSAAEGQALDTQIETGTVDTDTFASDGLTATQVQAVEDALTSTKESLVALPQLQSK